MNMVRGDWMNTLEIILLTVLALILMPLIFEYLVGAVLVLVIIIMCLALVIWLPIKGIINAVKR